MHSLVRRTAAGVAAALVFVSCKGVEPPPEVAITISPATAQLTLGGTQQLTASVSGSDDTGVTWSTSASSVATVSTSGLVTAVGTGDATITATADADPDKSASATITVSVDATTLTSGVAVTGISGATSSRRYYKIVVPTGATQLRVVTGGGSGDLDLYVKRASVPTTSVADCDSEGASVAETCTITNPAAGDWYIMLYAFSAYSGVGLQADVTGGTGGTPTAGFTIATSSTSNVVRGSSTALTITATRTGGFAGDVALTVTGLPSGVTAAFSPATLTGTQTTSTLTLTASASATTGTSTITVRGNSTGQTERTATSSLTVSAAGSSSIALELSTPSVTIGRGQHGWVAAGTTTSGSSVTATVVAENLPAGVSAEWGGSEDNAGSPSTSLYSNDYWKRVRLTVSAGAALGTSAITVRATPLDASIPAVTMTLQLTIVDPQAAANPGWTQLELGGISCGRRADGRAQCWGGLGMMGDGTLGGGLRVPAVAGMGKTYTSVTHGSTHGCGVATGGAAWCWGSNSFGQLGDAGASANIAAGGRIPRAVVGGHSFSSISAGNSFTCGLTTSGAAYCWGSQLGGALGDGVIATDNSQTKTSPTAVLGGITFASISVGNGHTCGLTSAGAAYCWGQNAQGQLGDGSTTTRAQPVAVGGALTFAKISAGEVHTCAVTAAGKGYCWGSYAKVGDAAATTTNKTAPYPIPGTHVFAEISAGFKHSCGITTAGVAYCWGDNFYGGLGNGASGASATSRSLVAVSGGHSFSRIAVGDYYACGVTTANALYCWGYNNYGLLGDGTTTNRTTPTLAKTY